MLLHSVSIITSIAYLSNVNLWLKNMKNAFKCALINISFFSFL